MDVSKVAKPKAEFKRNIGIFTAEVVGISPEADEIAKIYGWDEPKDEPTYLKEKEVEVPTGLDGDGQIVKDKITVDTARVDIYLALTKDGSIQKKSFFLENRPFLKKDASSRQFINSLGKTAWADDKSNLRQNFTHFVDKDGVVGDSKNVREAKVGEGDLVEFVDNWLHQRDKKNDTDLRISDMSKLFRGNLKELQSFVGSDIAGLVMGALTVRKVTNDEGEKFYQDVWKSLIPEFNAKFFANGKFDEAKIEALREKKKATAAKIKDKTVGKSDWLKGYETWILNATDPEYGIKDFYSLKPLHEFNEAELEMVHSQPIESDSSDY